MTTPERTSRITDGKVVLVAGGTSGLERAAQVADDRDRIIVVATARSHLKPVMTEGAQLDPSELRHLREALDDAEAFLAERGIASETVLAQGDPAEAIVKVAEQHNADLIIMGDDGPGLLERLRLGPLSNRIAHRAPCDVLIVH